MEIRKGKIASLDDARRLLRDEIYFSVMMVKLDDADGMVAGAVHASADIERPAFQILKTAKGDLHRLGLFRHDRAQLPIRR